MAKISTSDFEQQRKEIQDIRSKWIDKLGEG